MRVSALTITQPSREAFLAQARADLGAQAGGVEVEHVIIESAGFRSLGDARNESIARATCELVAQWDDDDRYGADRLRLQVSAMVQHGADAVFLAREILECRCGRRCVSFARRGLDGAGWWEHSMLGRRDVLVQHTYQTRNLGEDTAFCRSLAARGRRLVALDSDPELYVYRFHGQNSVSVEHFDNLLRLSGSPHRASECMRVQE